MYDLPHLPHCITSPMHQCMFMTFNQQNPNHIPKPKKKKNAKALTQDLNIREIG